MNAFGELKWSSGPGGHQLTFRVGRLNGAQVYFVSVDGKMQSEEPYEVDQLSVHYKYKGEGLYKHLKTKTEYNSRAVLLHQQEEASALRRTFIVLEVPPAKDAPVGTPPQFRLATEHNPVVGFCSKSGSRHCEK